MANGDMYVKCPNCGGLGGDCTNCVDGKTTVATVDVTDIMDKLAYIEGKVTAIWNAVKPGH